MINDVNSMNISSARILSVYSCDAYGANAYSAACTTSTGSDGGFLADTGYNILLPMALGVALIIAAIILLVRRLRRRSSVKS